MIELDLLSCYWLETSKVYLGRHLFVRSRNMGVRKFVKSLFKKDEKPVKPVKEAPNTIIKAESGIPEPVCSFESKYYLGEKLGKGAFGSYCLDSRNSRV